jgi:hypothetical protein
LRVMVNESIQPPVVVTAYRTSKISKYWAQYDARLRIDNRVRLSGDRDRQGQWTRNPGQRPGAPRSKNRRW